MRNIIIVFFLLCSVAGTAQIKSFSQLTDVSTSNITTMYGFAAKQKWKKHEEGKMDSLGYTRFIPDSLAPNNVSDCVMCFWRNKTVPLNYIVFQSANKATYNKFLAEAKKAGFVMKGNEKKGEEEKALYTKGKYNLSASCGRPTPKDPIIYMLGIRVIN